MVRAHSFKKKGIPTPVLCHLNVERVHHTCRGGFLLFVLLLVDGQGFAVEGSRQGNGRKESVAGWRLVWCAVLPLQQVIIIASGRRLRGDQVGGAQLQRHFLPHLRDVGGVVVGHVRLLLLVLVVGGGGVPSLGVAAGGGVELMNILFGYVVMGVQQGGRLVQRVDEDEDGKGDEGKEKTKHAELVQALETGGGE